MMDEHYIMFADKDEPETVLLKVFPSELRRKYSPQSTNETTRIGVHAVLVMALEYKQTDVIVQMNTSNGAPFLVDAIPIILDNIEAVRITIMPANVTIVLRGDYVNELERYIYYFYPNILETNKYGQQDLIDAGPGFFHTPPVAHGMAVEIRERNVPSVG